MWYAERQLGPPKAMFADHPNARRPMMVAPDNGVQAELFTGETLLWSGKPRPGFVLRAFDWLMMPLGLAFLGMGLGVFFEMLFPSNGQKNQPADLSFLFFPLPFVVVGAYFAFGRLLFERWLRSRSAYALTDRRAIIVQASIQKTVKSFALDELRDMRLTVRRDGVGTIIFNEGTSNGGYWAASAAMWGFGPAGFELVDDAREVYRLIGEAQAKLRA